VESTAKLFSEGDKNSFGFDKSDFQEKILSKSYIDSVDLDLS
jgi:hypothetical protein